MNDPLLKKRITLQKTPLAVLLVPALISFIIVSLVAILFLSHS